MTVRNVTGVGAVVASLHAGQFAPAAWSGVVSSDLAGVSPLTWIMALAEAVIWSAYGRSVGDWPLVFGGLGAAMTSIIILVALLQPEGKAAPSYLLRR